MTSMSMDDLESRRGWVVFAAIVMFSVGCFRIISGISYLAGRRPLLSLTLDDFDITFGPRGRAETSSR